MTSVEKRHSGRRSGGHRKHSDGGYSDTSSGGSFLDETDREVSNLTDRAFRSLCIGDEAVYNDSDLCASSPSAQRERQQAFSKSGQDRDKEDSEREELKRAAHESFSLRVQQYGQDWIHGGIYGAETGADPQWGVYGEGRTEGRVSATFQPSFVEMSQQEKSLKEEHLSFLSNGATELSSQQRRSRSRVSSLIKAFNSEGYRDGVGADGKLREWSNETSWDKSALMSIQRELSEFSSAYHQNFNSGPFPSAGPFSSQDNSFYSSEVATAMAHMNSTSSFMRSSHSKHSMSTQVSSNSNFFIHSEFSPFKVWRDHNRFPFQQGEVSGFMPRSEFPKWYETPMYKELSLGAQPQGPSMFDERGVRPQRKTLAPVAPPPPPPPPRSTSTSTMLHKASAVEKRCESELAGHYPNWKRTQSLGSNRLPSQRPSTVSPTIEMSRRVRDTLSSFSGLQQKLTMMTSEQNITMEMTANQQGVLHSSLIPFGNNNTAVTVPQNAVSSNTSTTPFNISQLLTPVIHTHQETETSEVQQYAVSPLTVEHPPVRAESRGATPDVRMSSYKSRATSLLFNLKDNRKRVKSTYSPTKFKGLDIMDKHKQPSNQDVNEPRDTVIDIPDFPDPDVQIPQVIVQEEPSMTDAASHQLLQAHHSPGLPFTALTSQPTTAHIGQNSEYTSSDYLTAQMQGEMVHHTGFSGLIQENYTSNQLANGQNLYEDLSSFTPYKQGQIDKIETLAGDVESSGGVFAKVDRYEQVKENKYGYSDVSSQERWRQQLCVSNTSSQDTEMLARAEHTRGEQGEKARVEQAEAERIKEEHIKVELAMAERAGRAKAEAEIAKAEQAKAEQAKAELAKAELAKIEKMKEESAKSKAKLSETEQAKHEPDKVEQVKTELAKAKAELAKIKEKMRGEQKQKVRNTVFTKEDDTTNKDVPAKNEEKPKPTEHSVVPGKDTHYTPPRALSYKERAQTKQEILTSKIKAHAEKEISAIKEKGFAIRDGFLPKNTTKSQSNNVRQKPPSLEVSSRHENTISNNITPKQQMGPLGMKMEPVKSLSPPSSATAPVKSSTTTSQLDHSLKQVPKEPLKSNDTLMQPPREPERAESNAKSIDEGSKHRLKKEEQSGIKSTQNKEQTPNSLGKQEANHGENSEKQQEGLKSKTAINTDLLNEKKVDPSQAKAQVKPEGLMVNANKIESSQLETQDKAESKSEAVPEDSAPSLKLVFGQGATTVADDSLQIMGIMVTVRERNPSMNNGKHSGDNSQVDENVHIGCIAIRVVPGETEKDNQNVTGKHTTIKIPTTSENVDYKPEVKPKPKEKVSTIPEISAIADYARLKVIVSEDRPDTIQDLPPSKKEGFIPRIQTRHSRRPVFTTETQDLSVKQKPLPKETELSSKVNKEPKALVFSTMEKEHKRTGMFKLGEKERQENMLPDVKANEGVTDSGAIHTQDLKESSKPTPAHLKNPGSGEQEVAREVEQRAEEERKAKQLEQERAAREEEERRAKLREEERRMKEIEEEKRAKLREEERRMKEIEEERREKQRDEERAAQEEEQRRAAQIEEKRRAKQREEEKRLALIEEQRKAKRREEERAAQIAEEKRIKEIEEQKKERQRKEEWMAAQREEEERRAAEKEEKRAKQREQQHAKEIEERTRQLEEERRAAQKEEEKRRRAAQRKDALQYYAITSTESERKPRDRHLRSPLPSQRRVDPSGVESTEDSGSYSRPSAPPSPAPALPRSNTSSPALGAKPTMFRVKDNTMRGSSFKSVKPRFHKNFGEDFRVGSPLESWRGSERGEEEQDRMRRSSGTPIHHDTVSGFNRLPTVKESLTPQPASSSQEYSAPLPEYRPFSRRSIALDEDDSRSVISNVSEDVESFATSATDLADLRGLYDYERPESACSFSSDVARSLGKPPTVPPKSEKALRRAQRLTTRRIKKELSKVVVDSPTPVEKPVRAVSSIPSSPTELRSSSRHALASPHFSAPVSLSHAPTLESSVPSSHTEMQSSYRSFLASPHATAPVSLPVASPHATAPVSLPVASPHATAPVSLPVTPKTVASVPSSPTLHHTSHPAPVTQYHVESGYAQSFPLTQRKVLQDLGSGQYFVVDMPVQVKTKTFFDPETGKYVQLNVRQSAQSGSRPQSQPAYSQPQLQPQPQMQVKPQQQPHSQVAPAGKPYVLYQGYQGYPQGYQPVPVSSLPPHRSSSGLSVPATLSQDPEPVTESQSCGYQENERGQNSVGQSYSPEQTPYMDTAHDTDKTYNVHTAHNTHGSYESYPEHDTNNQLAGSSVYENENPAHSRLRPRDIISISELEDFMDVSDW
ncbi:cardiac-enriched FHL2-interacting protein [Centroberyx gerrardi]